MDKNYLNLVMPFAVQTGLKTDMVSGTVYGSYSGFEVTVTPISGGRTFQISLAVKRAGAAPSLVEMQQITAVGKKYLAACSVSGYRVDFNVRPSALSVKSTVKKNLFPALETVVSNLKAQGYENCCQVCGTEEGVGPYYAYNCAARLCDTCRQSFVERNDIARHQTEQTSENIVGGIIGALLGSLIGAAAIILISRLGYIAAVSGVIMGVCALKGYEMLGGKLSKAGVVISTVIMVVMVFLSNQFDWAIVLKSEIPELGIFESFRWINYLLFNGGIELSTYLWQLILLYIFTFAGAAPTISSTMRRQTLPDTFYRIDEQNAEAGGETQNEPAVSEQSGQPK